MEVPMETMARSQARPDAGIGVLPEDAQERLFAIFEKHFDLMFFNQDENGQLRGRPMSRARVDDDGTTYFATRIDSKKVRELRADPRVTLSVQGSHEYAVVTGRARISQDRALIDQLWKDAWRIWFEQGPTDPSIAIVIVEPYDGTYWDLTKSQGLSFLWRAAKARLSGKEIERDAGDHEHVTIRRPPR
jgi:general stress protein 26